MQAVVCRKPGELALEDRPEPERGEAEVLVGVRRIGICGTDFHIYRGQPPVSELSADPWARTFRRGAGGAPRKRLTRGQTRRRQPLSLLRKLHRLPQWQAELLRADRGARRAPRRRHVRADQRAGGQSVSRRRAHPRSGRERRVPGNRCPRRRPLWPQDRRSHPGDRRRSDRTRHRTLRRLGRRRCHHHGPRRRAARLRDRERHRGPVDRGGRSASPNRFAEATGGEGFDVVFDATGSRGLDGGRLRPCRPWRHTGPCRAFVTENISFSDPEFHKREMTMLGSRNALRADFESVMAAIEGGRVPLQRLLTHRTSLAGVVSRSAALDDREAGAREGAGRDRMTVRPARVAGGGEAGIVAECDEGMESVSVAAHRYVLPPSNSSPGVTRREKRRRPKPPLCSFLPSSPSRPR